MIMVNILCLKKLMNLVLVLKNFSVYVAAAVRIKGRMDSFLTAKALAAGTTQVAVSVVIAGGAAEAKDLANLRRQATE